MENRQIEIKNAKASKSDRLKIVGGIDIDYTIKGETTVRKLFIGKIIVEDLIRTSEASHYNSELSFLNEGIKDAIFEAEIAIRKGADQ